MATPPEPFPTEKQKGHKGSNRFQSKHEFPINMAQLIRAGGSRLVRVADYLTTDCISAARDLPVLFEDVARAQVGPPPALSAPPPYALSLRRLLIISTKIGLVRLTYIISEAVDPLPLPSNSSPSPCRHTGVLQDVGAADPTDGGH